MLEEIREKVSRGLFEFTEHAVIRSIQRMITPDELRQAIAVGEVIEDYADDKYGPSCLISGFTRQGRPLHVQCSYGGMALVKIITIYQPDPAEWDDFRNRGSSNGL